MHAQAATSRHNLPLTNSISDVHQVPGAGDWIEAVEKDEFTFRDDEFNWLLGFLSQVERKCRL
jgi:hypothetical protein